MIFVLNWISLSRRDDMYLRTLYNVHWRHNRRKYDILRKFSSAKLETWSRFLITTIREFEREPWKISFFGWDEEDSKLAKHIFLQWLVLKLFCDKNEVNFNIFQIIDVASIFSKNEQIEDKAHSSLGYFLLNFGQP